MSRIIASQPGLPAPAPDEDDDEAPAQARITGQQLRESAHRYLEDGLLPVPAWSARQNGECCCPRGAACPRPGKHPRSVHTGPGPHDYSWKPLACRTQAEVDERFAPGGEYAAGNLMVAIPAGMMAIDRDDDDGGRAALAALAEELVELPPTLSHRTPHGEHLIYRTPPGWTGRAWVGKDPANPVPAGIDLRMPGQILMAAPSTVPGPGGPARYGPVTGNPVSVLPVAYVTAWTPPQPPRRSPSRPVPVPPGSADRAAKYVHDAMTRIADDLASRKPGGRNAAAYSAGLKAGSLLGAARVTPGAGQAAAAWTDEAAEDALMDAAERNGYIGKDGPAEARRAIRSGLRNGLRRPRALPDFTATRADRDRQHRTALGPAHPHRDPVASRGRGARWQDMVPDGVRREIEAADQAAGDRRRTAIIAHQRALERHESSATPETAAEVERTRAAARMAHRAYTQDGRHITGRHEAAMLRWAATAAQREHAPALPAPGPHDGARAQASRAALAANEAYRAGDLDQAGQLTDQAAALDPSRAELWQQHRNEIAARRLILSARAAYTGNDPHRAEKLLQDARQLDPRLRAIWNGELSAPRPARPARQHAVTRGPGDTRDISRTVTPQAGPGSRAPVAAAHAGKGTAQPSWPSSPARVQPLPSAAGQQAGSTQPPAQHPVAAAPREPRAQSGITADGAGASAEPADRNPAARWPAPNPRTVQEASPPGQQARSTVTASPALAERRQAGAAADAEAAGKTSPGRPAAPSADWRDQIIREAREPWQPGPARRYDPAVAGSPEHQAAEPGIEPEA